MEEIEEKVKDNRFAPKSSLVPVVSDEPSPLQPIVYDHGFSEEQVIRINLKKAELDKRNLIIEPVTLDEFKNIIIPFLRINRTEAFNLNPDKVKVVREKKEKVPSTRKPREKKVPGEVKLSKKAIEVKLSDIVFKMAVGEPLSSEDEEFFDKHTSKVLA